MNSSFLFYFLLSFVNEVIDNELIINALFKVKYIIRKKA